MSDSGQHVLPNLNGGWSVVRSGSTRASRVFPTHAAAVRYARDKAKREGSDLVVHRADFTVEEIGHYAEGVADTARSHKKR